MNLIIFLFFTVLEIGTIGYVFFKMQEYPMEVKLGIIITVSIVTTIVLRKILKKVKRFFKKSGY